MIELDQELNGGALVVPVAVIHTPSGRPNRRAERANGRRIFSTDSGRPLIGGDGIRPDHAVEPESDAESGQDPCLLRALDLFDEAARLLPSADSR